MELFFTINMVFISSSTCFDKETKLFMNNKLCQIKKDHFIIIDKIALYHIELFSLILPKLPLRNAKNYTISA